MVVGEKGRSMAKSVSPSDSVPARDMPPVPRPNINITYNTKRSPSLSVLLSTSPRRRAASGFAYIVDLERGLLDSLEGEEALA